MSCQLPRLDGRLKLSRRLKVAHGAVPRASQRRRSRSETRTLPLVPLQTESDLEKLESRPGLDTLLCPAKIVQGSTSCAPNPQTLAVPYLLRGACPMIDGPRSILLIQGACVLPLSDFFSIQRSRSIDGALQVKVQLMKELR